MIPRNIQKWPGTIEGGLSAVLISKMTTPAAATLSVAEAAELLGRHRTRMYALVRSGDLVAVPGTDGDEQSLRIDRSSVERWAVAGGSRGGPLTPRNAWAIIGLASGDQALAEHCLGLLERREEVSRARARLAARVCSSWRHGCVGARHLLSCTCRQRWFPDSRATSRWC